MFNKFTLHIVLLLAYLDPDTMGWLWIQYQILHSLVLLIAHNCNNSFI